MTDLDRAPATLLFPLIYCLLLEETEEAVERREELDAVLASYAVAGDGKPSRETWGKLPSHQRAMKRAAAAGGTEAKAGG